MSSEKESTESWLLEQLGSSLSAEYGAHTVLLYGSRARNEQTAASDVDLAAFADVERPIRKAFQSNRVFIDAFVYPEAVLDSPAQDHLKLRDSRILVDLKDAAGKFLLLLDNMHAAGPEPLPPDELEARRVWARKMLLRISDGGIDGNYRRAWLLTDMLEDYFHLRGMWYEGPKKSLKWLEENAPGVSNTIREALDSGAAIEKIRNAVERIYAPCD